jgi:hypothetical protein
MLIKSCVNHYFSLSFLRKKTLKKYVDMFLACQKSKVTIKLKFYYSNLENAVETAKIAVDSCYVLRQFLTPLPSIDFREIRGLIPALPRVGHNIDWCIMYESNPTAISPPPGNPRAFDLTLPPYRREFDGPVGNLTARPGI